LSGQQHIIRRQVLELEFADESETEAIEKEILALFNKKIVPMYDRFFNAYSHPDEIDQIACMELDLGEISLADLENELINKIADALDEQLEILCGTPVYDDPDELMARLGLDNTSTASLDATEAKRNELAAFFEQHQPEKNTVASLEPDPETEAEKRRNDLIRFFEQQSQISDDTYTEDAEEDDEPETVEPIRIEINYLPPDNLNTDLTEPVMNGEKLASEREAESEREADGRSPLLPSNAAELAPVSESVLLSNANILHYFLQTGLFPWWAKNSSKSQLEQALLTLIHQQPEALQADLQAWLTHKAIRKRLVAAFSDVYLVKLLELLVSAGQSPDAVSVNQLLNTLTGQVFPSERNRLLFWEQLFQDVRFLQQGLTVVPETWIHQVFTQTEIIKSSVAKSLIRSKLLTTIDRLFQLSKTHADWLKLEELTARFSHYPQADNWFSVFLAGRNNPTDHQNSIVENESLENPSFTAETEMKELVDEVFPDQSSDTDSLIAILLKLQKTHTSGALHVVADEPENIPTIPLAIDPFSESEKLYVRNAGMILLWPFLERYFEKNGLLSESTFIHKQAQEQAAWLLQRLVMGPAYELFEPHIALNKVIAGLQPETPVHAPEPITEAQQLLMDELLAAVMEHVPAWKNLSVEQLRNAYLQREGALSTRDGQWLLQVKRETYDILLEKLPWPIQLIRLPWLEHLLVVEW
jgi:Contractile injection system tape measure protein